MTKKEFVKKYTKLIVISTEGTPLFPSVKMAQAILESGTGSSQKMMKANAMFGIKGYGLKSPYWQGKVFNSSTKEVIQGTEVTINDSFRAYDTMGDGVRDHTYLIMNLSIYKQVREAATPEAQAQALQAGGYATATNYAGSLINLINELDLKELDKKKSL